MDSITRFSPPLTRRTDDTDEDGFVDSDDDCDLIVGTFNKRSTGLHRYRFRWLVRYRSGWDVQNGADAFENDATQWRDRDFDGYGDNILGNQPDHCPTAVDTQLQTDMVALILTEIPIPMLTLVDSMGQSRGMLIQMV